MPDVRSIDGGCGVALRPGFLQDLWRSWLSLFVHVWLTVVVVGATDLVVMFWARNPSGSRAQELFYVGLYALLGVLPLALQTLAATVIIEPAGARRLGAGAHQRGDGSRRDDGVRQALRGPGRRVTVLRHRYGEFGGRGRPAVGQGLQGARVAADVSRGLCPRASAYVAGAHHGMK